MTKQKQKTAISLRRQIALTFLGLFVAIQTVLMVANYVTSRTTVVQRINADLDQSIKTFLRVIDGQLADLNTQSALLAKDFGFKQALATKDKATIQSALQNIQSRAQLDMAFVLDGDGALVAMVGDKTAPSLPENMNRTAVIDLARDGSDKPYFMVRNGQLYEMSILPIRAPVFIGAMAFGKALNNDQAKLIQSFTSEDLNVAFAHKIEQGWQISGQSGESQFLDFLTKGRMDDIQTEGYIELGFKGDSYSVRALPLAGSNGSDQDRYLLVYASLDKAMSSYTVLFWTLLGVGIAGMVLMFIGGYVISDRVSAPIRALAAGASEIAKGSYDPLKAQRSFKEVNNLQDSFNAMISAVREREDKISSQAMHDMDTGLPNSQYLNQTITDALAANKGFALVIAEIRDFQELRTVLDYNQINDIARLTGERLNKVTAATVARVSTDNFAFVIENSTLAKTMMKGIIEAFMIPFSVNEMPVDVNLVIGYAVAPKDGDTPEELTLSAHSALDEARISGEDVMQCQDRDKSSQERHLSLMSDLRSEIKEGHVLFHYQPKLALQTGKIMGAEALIRWFSPKHGFVPPDQFIELAERTGDIRQLTQWGLDQIMAQASKFKADGIDMLMAANLSTRDLQNEKLPDLMQHLIKEYGLKPQSICLEVTESAIMGDTKRALSILNRLADMGIYLSIDDYGTGYSSLAYIKSLPVDELKIDKAFVLKLATSSEDKILVQSTIDLAHNLGMKVTAEGVEDAESLELLKSYGCDTAQGYHIARPIPPADFATFWKDTNG